MSNFDRLAAICEAGGVLRLNRDVVQNIGRSLYEEGGSDAMQFAAISLRRRYTSGWKSHPQEVDFAWDGIGGWRA